MLALIVAVPVTLLQLIVGNRFGEAVTSAQSMKIAASEAQWNTCQPCGFSALPDRRVHEGRPDAELLDHDPEAPLVHGHRLVRRPGSGPQPAAGEEQSEFGPGNYMPDVRVIYWSMRAMAYAGVLMFLVAALGAWLYRRQKLEQARWFQRTAIAAIALPYIAATAGWILTEMGRQPWIVQDAPDAASANSPSVSTTWLGISLGVLHHASTSRSSSSTSG